MSTIPAFEKYPFDIA